MHKIESIGSDIFFDDLAYTELGKHLSEQSYSKIFILVDENTKKYCLDKFCAQCMQANNAVILEIYSGEEFKTIETCTELWKKLSKNEADRHSLLINLGGGVITDLGAFVASTFMRGIAFINVPTSLLAMVDASVGGKTGVDLGSLKNQVGTFSEGKMVLIINDFLETLPKEHLRSGLAEILKHGLIADKNYWAKSSSVKELDWRQLSDLVYRSVFIKNEIVLEDPKESGKRKHLNFGHTLGHAIESYCLENPEREVLLHGEAIAIGMILEAFISHKVNGLSKNELDEIKNVISGFFKQREFNSGEIEKVISLMKFDKKNRSGKVLFVLLSTIGKASINHEVSEELIQEAFSYYAEK